MSGNGNGETRLAVRWFVGLVMASVIAGSVTWAGWTTVTLIEIRVALAALTTEVRLGLGPGEGTANGYGRSPVWRR
jgi:hypothetical protein